MPVAEGSPQTLYDKVLQAHVVDEKLDGTLLLYIGTVLPPRPSHGSFPLFDALSTDALYQIVTSFTKSPHP